MRNGRVFWALELTLAAGCVAVAGCGGDTDRSGGSDCPPGAERCACYGNNTCNEGLTCASGLCVGAADGGAGGTGGDDTGGTGGDDTGGTGGSAGLGGSAAAGGTGGVPPSDDILLLSAATIDKLDLLFVIDNSISMADKQEILEQAVPQLVNRLVDPICVNAETGQPLTPTVSSSQGCPAGSEPEFRKVDDIHIGLVTSSLGGHGGVLCTPEHGLIYWNEMQNDRGRLIARAGPSGVPPVPYDQHNFLAWDPTNRYGGEADRFTLIQNFQYLVTGAGEQGCGYEATLESWYRFLVHPDPPMDVVFNPETGLAEPVGVDDVLLAQRAQFLRPDSLVAIIMLSDENDCSIADGGIGYLVGDTREGALPRSTSVCDTNPNDQCCLSCIQANWPSGCGNPMADPKCQQAAVFGDIDSSLDRLNLRCFDQKRRFGLDFLNPIQRYVDGLQLHELETRDGQAAPNPLFSASDVYPDQVPRMDSSRIYLVGIVGVPWQDLATDESLADPIRLEYLTANELSQQGIWDIVLGDPQASPPVPPTDPFMIQSVEPRSGINPRTGDPITPPQVGAGGNPINGHEYVINNNGDLQYACIFPLTTSKECMDVEPGVGCDCKVSNEVVDRPLCEGTTQVFAKAYPGTRFLEVLKDYGANSIVASICPKNTQLAGTDPDYGYNPAMAAIVDRLKETLRGSCLPGELPVDAYGMMPCQVVEVTRQPNIAPCAGNPGRKTAPDDVAGAILQQMRALGMCGGSTNPCSDFSLCQLTPAGYDPNNPSFDDPLYQECLNAPDSMVQNATGYCYIDAMHVDPTTGEPAPIGNPELVAACPATQRRLLRFVAPPGAPVEQQLPWPNSTVFVNCQGVGL